MEKFEWLTTGWHGDSAGGDIADSWQLLRMRAKAVDASNNDQHSSHIERPGKDLTAGVYLSQS